MSPDFLERDPVGLEVGIKIKNIKKVFSTEQGNVEVQKLWSLFIETVTARMWAKFIISTALVKV